MRTDSFEYELPPELIAQFPASRRDDARLLQVDRATGALDHLSFREFGFLLRRGDLLVLNDTKVMAARLKGQKAGSGGVVEALLLDEVAKNDWWTMLRPGKRVRSGSEILFTSNEPGRQPVRARLVEKNLEGHCRLRFEGSADIACELDSYGELPLPPYIHRNGEHSRPDDDERYQTVYARQAGSIAAPTAGLHFTPELLRSISGLGVEVRFVTLHVGHGTFAPVKAEEISAHQMHHERFNVPLETAAAVNRAKAEGRRVIAVGTTSLRTLESVARANSGRVVAGSARTNLFLHPPADFLVVKALLTNFHLPRSTLLMLVSAFAAPAEVSRGRDLILSAYAEAIRERYRFYSYGDAMFIR